MTGGRARSVGSSAGPSFRRIGRACTRPRPHLGSTSRGAWPPRPHDDDEAMRRGVADPRLRITGHVSCPPRAFSAERPQQSSERFASRQILGYMMELLSADVEGMSKEEEVSSRRGALKLLLMNQARMFEVAKVVASRPPAPRPPPLIRCFNRNPPFPAAAAAAPPHLPSFPLIRSLVRKKQSPVAVLPGLIRLGFLDPVFLRAKLVLSFIWARYFVPSPLAP